MLLKYLTSRAPHSQQRLPVERGLTVPELFAKLKINVLENVPIVRKVSPPVPSSSFSSSSYSVCSSPTSSSSASSPVPSIEKHEPMPSPVESEDEGVCCFDRVCSVSPVASEAEDRYADVEEARRTWADAVNGISGEEPKEEAVEAVAELEDERIEEATIPETKAPCPDPFPNMLMGEWLPIKRSITYKNGDVKAAVAGALLTFEKVEIHNTPYLRTNYMGAVQDVTLDQQWRHGERWRFAPDRLILDFSVTESEDNMDSITFSEDNGCLISTEVDFISKKEARHVRQSSEKAAP